MDDPDSRGQGKRTLGTLTLSRQYTQTDPAHITYTLNVEDQRYMYHDSHAEIRNGMELITRHGKRKRERESKKERVVVQAMRDAASGCSGRKLGRQREA